MPRTDFKSVDEYMAAHPRQVRTTLRAVRNAVRKALGGAQEMIRYGMPTYTLDGRPVIYFAGWKRHISIYPIPAADAALRKAMAAYESGKGTLKFPLSEPIPYELIGRIAAAARKSRG